jgi:hypothetical protein
VREVVMAMCVRRGCAFVITFCCSSPSPSTLFCGLSLKMGLVDLMFLTPHFVLPSK